MSSSGLTGGSEALRVLIDPPMEPAANMARDEELAEEVREAQAPAALRIYRWNQPAISIGRRQNPDDLPADLMARGLPLVRRPTGGGAVLHRVDELTYALATRREFVPRHLPVREFSRRIHQNLRDELVRSRALASEELQVAG